MARITVEDCLQKIDSQYDLVMLAKERTAQLNAGDPLLVPKENDKHTVVALREIAEGKISVKTLEDLGIEKLRKNASQTNEELEDLSEATEDDFDKVYKGEVSKSGTAILPSKRSKRMPVEKTKLDEVKLKEDNKEDSLPEDKIEEEKNSEENKTE